MFNTGINLSCKQFYMYNHFTKVSLTYYVITFLPLPPPAPPCNHFCTHGNMSVNRFHNECHFVIKCVLVQSVIIITLTSVLNLFQVYHHILYCIYYIYTPMFLDDKIYNILNLGGIDLKQIQLSKCCLLLVFTGVLNGHQHLSDNSRDQGTITELCSGNSIRKLITELYFSVANFYNSFINSARETPTFQ